MAHSPTTISIDCSCGILALRKSVIGIRSVTIFSMHYAEEPIDLHLSRNRFIDSFCFGFLRIAVRENGNAINASKTLRKIEREMS